MVLTPRQYDINTKEVEEARTTAVLPLCMVLKPTQCGINTKEMEEARTTAVLPLCMNKY